MTTIAVAPIVLKDIQLLIPTDEYAAHVSSVVLTPNTTTQTWKGLTPTATFTSAGTPEWTCQLEYAQDWVTVNSLSNYLFAHQGETVVAKFQPKKGTGLPEWTVSLVIAAGPVGGSVDQYMTGSVTLGVSGQPTKANAA
jgi:hypothetical protein